MNSAAQSEFSPFLQFLARSCDSALLRNHFLAGASPWAHCPGTGATALSLLVGHGRAAPEAISVWLEFAGDLSKRPWPATHPHPLQCIITAGPAIAALVLQPFLEAGLPVMDEWRPGKGALGLLFPEHTPQAHMSVYARWQVACLLGKHEPAVAQWEWRGKPLWIAALENQYVPEDLLGCILTWPGIKARDLDWRRANSVLTADILVPWVQQRFGIVLKNCGIPLLGVDTLGVSLFSALLRAFARTQLQQSNPFQMNSAHRKLNFPRKRIEWMIKEGMVNWTECAVDGQTALSLARTLSWENPEDLQSLLDQWQLGLLDEAVHGGQDGRGRL